MGVIDEHGGGGPPAEQTGAFLQAPLGPEERLAAARRGWRAALARGDREDLADGALRLQQAQAWPEAIAAYLHLADRFPVARAEAARGTGDCFLFSVYANAGVALETRIAVLEMALRWYDVALQHGHPRGWIEDSYWSACEMLFQAHGGDRARRLHSLQRYQRAFPDGPHRDDASRYLEALRPS